MLSGRAASGIWFTVGVLSAFCVVSPAGFAQTTSRPVASAAVQQGKTTFQQSCAVCHGERGDGKGPAATALTPRPADLTTLAKRKGGFPAAQIAAILKGGEPAPAHGGPMLFWGAYFLADANGDQAKADAHVNEIVKFIESIQVK